MANKLDEVVNHLIDGMHQISKIETIVGEPIQAGDAMLVPIHRLRVGFGVATVGAGGQTTGGEGRSGGRGIGGGVQVEPIAIIAIGKDGRPRLMAVDGDSEMILGQLLDQIPDLVGRVLKLFTRKKDEDDVTAVKIETSRGKPKLAEKE